MSDILANSLLYATTSGISTTVIHLNIEPLKRVTINYSIYHYIEVLTLTDLLICSTSLQAMETVDGFLNTAGSVVGTFIFAPNLESLSEEIVT